MPTTICISDLHAGGGPTDPRDNFSVNGRPARFNAFLDWVEAQDARLYILGDLCDWWQCRLSESVQAYWQLLSRLDMLGSVYIPGNHDSDLNAFIGTSRLPPWPLLCRARRPFCEVIGSRRFLFCHGHEADPYCRDDKPGKGEISAIISALLEDRNGSPVDSHGHAIEDQSVGIAERALSVWRKLTFQETRLEELIDGIEDYRQQHAADVVCCGHSHVAGRLGDWHYNSGSWARDRDTFVSIDDSTGNAAVFEWTKDCKPAPYDHCL